MANERGQRRTRTGVVVSDKMTKTRVVAVRWSQPHPLYQRQVRRVTKFKAHDADNSTHEGDTVRIVETRPLSKEKRWRIVEVVARGERVDVRPEEVGETLIEEFGQKSAPAPVEEAAAPVAQAETPETAPSTPAVKAEAKPAEEEEPAAAAPAPAEEEEKPGEATPAAEEAAEDKAEQGGEAAPGGEKKKRTAKPRTTTRKRKKEPES